LKKLQLKGLNSLRAIAAIVVIVSHIEKLKTMSKVNNDLEWSFLKNTGGHVAVILFFVLSGFLITTLLLQEKEKTQKINLKNFYIRRILRVWPLYFIILAGSVIFVNYSPRIITWVLCLAVFPNIAEAFYVGWAGSLQIWSIGVEEQFYLGWPILMKFCKKRLMLILIIFFFGLAFLPLLVNFIGEQMNTNSGTMDYIDRIFNLTKFNCMAMGGIFAVISLKYERLSNFLNRKIFVFLSIILSFSLWFGGFYFDPFNNEVYSIIFGLLIFNLSYSKHVPATIDIAPMKFLGKISYGLYMYHWIVISMILHYFGAYFQKNTNTSNIVLYIFVLGATIIVSTASYYLVELRLLKLKDKFNSA
jgi:peptidoglycan/LPS O-acetylase OafA/YrhL